TGARLLSQLANQSAHLTFGPAATPPVGAGRPRRAERTREDLGDAATGRKGANVRPVGTL
ncbi:MAG: hypothetical protein OXH92_21170, partial [Bryobacterales bacterium]|nr:hypothetical protein [Bryobacterales bacterium]